MTLAPIFDTDALVCLIQDAVREVMREECAAPSPAAGGSQSGIYTVEEVAELLQTTRQTVGKLIHSGELSAMKVGGKWKIPVQWFEDWQNSKRRGA